MSGPRRGDPYHGGDNQIVVAGEPVDRPILADQPRQDAQNCRRQKRPGRGVHRGVSASICESSHEGQHGIAAAASRDMVQAAGLPRWSRLYISAVSLGHASSGTPPPSRLLVLRLLITRLCAKQQGVYEADVRLNARIAPPNLRARNPGQLPPSHSLRSLRIRQGLESFILHTLDATAPF